MKLYLNDRLAERLVNNEEQALALYSKDHNFIIVNKDPETIRFQDLNGKPHKYVHCDFGYYDKDHKTKEPLETQFLFLNPETEETAKKKFGAFVSTNPVRVLKGIGGPIYENSASPNFHFGVYKIKTVIREVGRSITDILWQLNPSGWDSVAIPKNKISPIEMEFAAENRANILKKASEHTIDTPTMDVPDLSQED